MGLILPNGQVVIDKSYLKIATLDDLDLVVEMGMKFAKESNYSEYADEEVIREFAKTLITSDNSSTIVILYAKAGVIGGAKVPFIYGKKTIATELFWWVEPELRKMKIGDELISAFEFWAKQVGCDLITMVGLDDKLDRFYTNKGYKLYERAYMKKI